MDTYKKLIDKYPELLISDEYISGTQAKYYIIITDKLIMELLDGVQQYFIQWCVLNYDENYEETY